MKLWSNSFADNATIPGEFAFGVIHTTDHVALSANRNPHLAWSEVPATTRSFALTCIDSDAPSVGDDVNRADRRVPASLPRTDFTHWLIADLPSGCRELAQGSCADGVVARGRRTPAGPPGSHQGRNDYSGWFAGDADMAGDYLGYDGPCPPWNDERMHHYRFHLYALDVESLGLRAGFTRVELDAALQGHVLAEARLTGTYALSAALRR